MDPDLIATFGRYQIVRLLGEGGMGRVYLAGDPKIERQVAIKVLLTKVDQDQLLREARAAGRLTHPTAVTIYDVGEHDGQPFIAMEYVNGVTLDTWIMEQRPVPLVERLRLLEQLGEGLAAAHEAGIVHRDIKPSNLMAERSGRLRILDFGIARVSDSHTPKTQGIVGSIGYMAPEQLAGGRADHRSDIFAATVVAYELVAYKRAYPGGLGEASRRLKDTSVSSVQPFAPGVGAAIDEIVRRGLQLEPNNRFRNAHEFSAKFKQVRERLERAATGSDARLAPVVPASALDSTVILTGNASLSSTVLFRDAPAPPPRRVWWLVATAAVLAVGVGAALVVQSAWKSSAVTPAPLPVQQPQASPTSSGTPPASAGTTTPKSRGAVPPQKPAQDPAGATGGAVAPAPEPRAVSDQADGAVGRKTEGANDTPTGPSPEGLARDKEAVGAVIAKFAGAFAQKSSSVLKTFYPNLSIPELNTLDRNFLEAQSYEMTIADVTIQVAGDRALATCQISVTKQPVSGPARPPRSGLASFQLSRTPGGWVITRYEGPL